MKLKDMRETCGMSQRELVSALNAEGLKVNKSDISRIENGIIETYLFLAHKCEEICKSEIIRQKPNNATVAKIESCNTNIVYANRIYERIKDKGFTDYDDLRLYLGESDRRKIRYAVQAARERYPIIELDRGWGLAESVAECDKQLRLYEKKKRAYSYQETPLIAKKYELRSMGNGLQF